MTKDGFRNLTIEYNLLNFPKNVKNSTGGSLEYIYDAAGNKLAKKLNGAFVNFYCGSVVYTGSKTVEYVMHSQGMARLNGNWDYQYNVTDHLGNVRSVASSSNAVLQSTDYFPFGRRIVRQQMVWRRISTCTMEKNCKQNWDMMYWIMGQGYTTQ